MHQYDDEFFEYIERGSVSSAKAICRIIASHLRVSSVLDVGCGRGAWLREWKNCGVRTVHGADGPYVKLDSLLVPTGEFTSIDLTHEFNIGHRYDLVTSLEVAEHLPPSSSAPLIESLTSHSDKVLFSAATPGQGGENHINERPLSFWQELFRLKGFEAFDFVRPLIASNGAVEPWYKFNTILYVRNTAFQTIPPAVFETRLGNKKVGEVGNLAWRARKAILKGLPTPAVTAFSRMNYRRLNRAYRRKMPAMPSD